MWIHGSVWFQVVQKKNRVISVCKFGARLYSSDILYSTDSFAEGFSTWIKLVASVYPQDLF